MITLHAPHIRLCVHPLALLLPPLGLALGLREALPALLLSLLVHELGHMLAARLAHVRVTALTIMPFGCGLQLGNVYTLSPWQLLTVSAGGPMASLLLVVIDAAMAHWGWLSPAFALSLMQITLALLLFNLLPALPLDGGRILYALTAVRLGRERAVHLAARLGYIVALGLIALTLWLYFRIHRINLALPICAIFILYGIAEDRRALCEAIPSSLLNALRSSHNPVAMHLCAVDGTCPALDALRHAAPDAATLYAVYHDERLAAFVDDRALLRLALEHPDAAVIDAALSGDAPPHRLSKPRIPAVSNP